MAVKLLEAMPAKQNLTGMRRLTTMIGQVTGCQDGEVNTTTMLDLRDRLKDFGEAKTFRAICHRLEVDAVDGRYSLGGLLAGHGILRLVQPALINSRLLTLFGSTTAPFERWRDCCDCGLTDPTLVPEDLAFLVTVAKPDDLLAEDRRQRPIAWLLAGRSATLGAYAKVLDLRHLLAKPQGRPDAADAFSLAYFADPGFAAKLPAKLLREYHRARVAADPDPGLYASVAAASILFSDAQDL